MCVRRILLLLVLAGAAAQGTSITSNFSDGTTQGWTVVTLDIPIVITGRTVGVLFNPIEGAIYLELEDTANGRLCFAAPGS